MVSIVVSVLLSVLGVALVAVALYDFLRTTLQLRGAGPLSNLMGEVAYRVVSALQRSMPKRRILPSLGMIVLLLSIGMWTILLWSGWLLLFLAQPHAVIDSSTGEPSGLWSRVYFVGFSIVTLGVGDHVPSGGFYQVLTVLAAATGFFFMTLSVTYLVPVVSAVVQTRQLSAQLFSLGPTPHEMVLRTWEGGTCQAFIDSIGGLAPSILLLAERYFAYPVLQYFFVLRREDSAAIGIAALDEAVTLLLDGSVGQAGVSAARLRLVREAISRYLDALDESFVQPAAEPPPAPSLKPLRDAGIPTVGSTLFEERLARLAHHRKLLKATVEREHWSWGDLYPEGRVDRS